MYWSDTYCLEKTLVVFELTDDKCIALRNNNGKLRLYDSDLTSTFETHAII